MMQAHPHNLCQFRQGQFAFEIRFNIVEHAARLFSGQSCGRQDLTWRRGSGVPKQQQLSYLHIGST
jgi:hypothetical protein